MPNPRLASIRAAERATAQMETLFDRLGNTEHPRGQILAAYRNAQRAMRDVLDRRGIAMRQEAAEVMRGLARDVGQSADELLAQAAAIGQRQGQAEARAWNLRPTTRPPQTAPMRAAWLAEVERQTAAVDAFVAMDDPGYILGDAPGTGALSPRPVIDAGLLWLMTAAVAGWAATVQADALALTGEYHKQAVAAVDDRTTDCCLRVNGQTVPLDGKFHLTGEPRFSDHQDWSPFHWNCRTSVVLIPATMTEDDLTERLRNQSVVERERRAYLEKDIADIKQQLAALGTFPDVRVRNDDTRKMLRLRWELRELRGKLTGGGS